MDVFRSETERMRRRDAAIERFWQSRRRPHAAHVPSKNQVVSRYPDFFIIGAQKAGTTWLVNQLLEHPLLWLPIVKELHYFEEVYLYPDERWPFELRRSQYINSLAATDMRLWKPAYLKFAEQFYTTDEAVNDSWYSRNFSSAGIGQLCGDGTVSNGVLPIVAVAHMRRLSPHAKCILIVRDPIERSWSHLRMLAHERGVGEEAFSDLLDEYAGTLFACSNYREIYDNFSYAFGAANVLVCNYSELANRPFGVLESVCNFLGVVCDHDFFPYANEVAFRGPEFIMPGGLREKMANLLQPVISGFRDLRPDIAEEWARTNLSRARKRSYLAYGLSKVLK